MNPTINGSSTTHVQDHFDKVRVEGVDALKLTCLVICLLARAWSTGMSLFQPPRANPTVSGCGD